MEEERPQHWTVRDEMAKKLADKRGGKWYWAGDYGDNDHYILGGQDVSANTIAGITQERMMREGIISAVQGVPVQSGQETRTATFYQKGPNFDSKGDRIQAIVTETWGSLSQNPLKLDTVKKDPDDNVKKDPDDKRNLLKIGKADQH